MLISTTHKFVSTVPNDGIPGRVQPDNWNDEHASTSHCRADIPSLTITQDTFMVSGYYVAGDIGKGAIYTSIGATATGLQAIQDATGKWFNLVVSDGVVNLGWIGFKNDGIFDNTTIADNFRFNHLKTLGAPSIPTVVTIDIANPALIHWTNHCLRVNDAISFSTTGVLPTGIAPNVTYYVLPFGMTRNAFQISTKNPYPVMFDSVNGGYGTPVITSGVQSGVHSVRILGYDWVTIIIPPGKYFAAGGSLSLAGNQRKTRIYAYGAVFNTGPQAQSLSETYAGVYFNGFGKWAAIRNASLSYSGINQQLVLKNPADAALFDVGGWIAVCALDLQNSFGSLTSWPPNSHYNEFVRILDIDRVNGILTIIGFMQNNYSYAYPMFYGGNGAQYGGGNSNTAHGGPALAIYVNSDWDSEWEVYGLRTDNFGSAEGASAWHVKIVDCTFDYDGMITGVIKQFTAENCNWQVLTRRTGLGNDYIEVDKMIEDARFTNCTWDTLLLQSSSVDRLTVDKCKGDYITGTVRNMHIKDSQIGNLTIGCGIGSSDSLVVENCRIGQVRDLLQSFGWFGQAVHKYTLSNGVLSCPMSFAGGNANAWAVPGRNMYVKHLKAAIDQTPVENMGSPFQVLDVFESGSPNAAITFTVGNPTIVNWNAHGLAAGTQLVFTITPGAAGGGLPTGVFHGQPYYVLAAGLAANSFEISETAGGTPVVSSGSMFGSITALANPMFNIRTNLLTAPVGDMTSSTVTISITTPAVVTWNAHGLTANTPVCFETTGALPTGMAINTLYYVLAAGLTGNTFEFSTSVGGAPVNTSGTQFGVHTAIANPLYFSRQSVNRVTFRNCTGDQNVMNLCNAPAEFPPWSYASLRIFGDILLTWASGIVFGKIISMSINVIRPDTTGSGALLNITCPAFDDNLLSANLSVSINVAIAGLRTITQTGASGAQAGDVNVAAFANWLANQVSFVFSASIFGIPAQWPLVEFVVRTDQGYTVSRPLVWAAFDNPVTLTGDNSLLSPSTGG